MKTFTRTAKDTSGVLWFIKWLPSILRKFQQLYPNGAPQGNTTDKDSAEGSEVSKTDGNNQDIKDTDNPGSSSRESRIEPKKDYGTMILAAVLVGCVVLVTLLLLLLLKKRKTGL